MYFIAHCQKSSLVNDNITFQDYLQILLALFYISICMKSMPIFYL